MVTWGGDVEDGFRLRVAVWRVEKEGSGTLEGRERRGRKEGGFGYVHVGLRAF